VVYHLNYMAGEINPDDSPGLADMPLDELALRGLFTGVFAPTADQLLAQMGAVDALIIRAAHP